MRNKSETGVGNKVETRQQCKNAGFFMNLWLWFLQLTIGYGYYIHRLLGWFAVFTAIGVEILCYFNHNPVGFLDKAFYSLDMLIPLIKLNDAYTFTLTGYAKYYFYFHKLLGFLLASTLIAGLSGITKK